MRFSTHAACDRPILRRTKSWLMGSFRRDNVTHEVSQRWRINYDLHIIRSGDYKGSKLDTSQVKLRLPFNACTFPGFWFCAFWQHYITLETILPCAHCSLCPWFNQGGIGAASEIVPPETSRGGPSGHGPFHRSRLPSRSTSAPAPQSGEVCLARAGSLIFFSKRKS